MIELNRIYNEDKNRTFFCRWRRRLAAAREKRWKKVRS